MVARRRIDDLESNLNRVLAELRSLDHHAELTDSNEVVAHLLSPRRLCAMQDTIALLSIHDAVHRIGDGERAHAHGSWQSEREIYRKLGIAAPEPRRINAESLHLEIADPAAVAVLNLDESDALDLLHVMETVLVDKPWSVGGELLGRLRGSYCARLAGHRVVHRIDTAHRSLRVLYIAPFDDIDPTREVG